MGFSIIVKKTLQAAVKSKDGEENLPTAFFLFSIANSTPSDGNVLLSLSEICL